MSDAALIEPLALDAFDDRMLALHHSGTLPRHPKGGLGGDWRDCPECAATARAAIDLLRPMVPEDALRDAVGPDLCVLLGVSFEGDRDPSPLVAE